MGFFTTFLIICVLGFFSHSWYHRYGLSKGHLAWISYFTFIVVGGFLILDLLIYIGVFNFIFPILNLIPWVNIDNGTDFMWNSFQLLGFNWGINYNDPNLDYIAILIFLSYPMWFMFFKEASRILFGGNKSRPHEQGLWFLFAPTKKPKKDERAAKVPTKT